ncbi:SurA N-terminal domain-containing protein [Desulfogranum japonicum]|uniref:SurA N-terminal domain-containing protein n=1 Tax=Desulfogranum japonicum TaxID=231447 RepID=UPI00042A0658
MLNIFRKKRQSIVSQGIVLIIMIVFVFWGVGTYMNKGGNAAAIVNGTEISRQDFGQSYERTADRYQKQFGGQMTPEMMKSLGLRRQVLEQLIQRELLRQGAEELGLQISEEELQRTILEMDAFQAEGAFSEELYRGLLSGKGFTPTSFEKGLKEDLIIQKVSGTLGTFTDVTPAELEAWKDFAREEIRLGYVAFSADSYTEEVEVTDEKLTEWYKDNGEQFKTDPQVQLKYLYYTFADAAAAVHITEDDVRNRYDSRSSEYQTPEERHARHILFKVNSSDSDEVKAAKKKEAEDILARARKGENFADLAKQYSEGPTKDRGGDLGFFQQGRMVPAFDKAVFSMKQGEISEPVLTQFGYHIIQLEEIKPAQVTSFESVRDKIQEIMQEEAAHDIVYNEAAKAYEDIMLAGSLEKFAKQNNLVLKTTDLFDRENAPEEIASQQAMLDAAFSLQKGELSSSALEVKDGYVILFVEDRKEPSVPDLNTVKDAVAEAYVKEQSKELARQAAEKYLQECREKDTLVAGPTVKESAFIKRNSTSDIPPQLVQAAFSSDGKQHLGGNVVDVTNTFYVYAVLETRLGKDELPEAQLEQLQQQLLESKKNRLVNQWLQKLHNEAKIWVNPDVLQ